MEGNKILIAILAIVLAPVVMFATAFVGGGVFAIIDDGGCTQSTSGFAADGVRISDFGITEEGLALEVRNAESGVVKINSVTLNGTTESYSEVTLSVGGSRAVTVQGFTKSGNCSTLDLQINYSKEGSIGQAQGTLQAKIKAEKE
ncbi:MAG: hypothetical protein ABEJ95_06565 [Candidatus Nanohalobium sp.]